MTRFWQPCGCRCARGWGGGAAAGRKGRQTRHDGQRKTLGGSGHLRRFPLPRLPVLNPPPSSILIQLCAALQRQLQPPKGLPPSKLVQRLLNMTRTVKMDKPELAEVVSLVRQTLVC